MMCRMENTSKYLLNSDIPASDILNLNTHKACPLIVKKYDRLYKSIIDQTFHSTYDPNSGREIYDIQKIPTEFIINEQSILICDNLWIPKASKVVISLGPKFIFGGRITAEQVIEMNELTDKLTNLYGIHESIIELKKQKLQLQFDAPRGLFTGYDYHDTITFFLRKCLFCHNEFMEKNPQIQLVNADKGSIIAVMNKGTYNRKMNEHLAKGISDGTYKIILNIDSTLTTLKYAYMEAVDIYNEWLGKGIIHHYTGNHQKLGQAQGQFIPKIYGNIKTHKTNKPFRPIVSDHSSVLRIIQDALKIILKYYIEQGQYKFVIKNSYQIIEDLANIQSQQHSIYSIKHKHKLYTMDFSSMYTNIDIEYFLSIINKYYVTYNVIRFGISIQDLLQLLRINICIFGYIKNTARIDELTPRYFKQNKGIPMGGKLSYAISEVVTSEAMQEAIAPHLNKMSFIYKYVDDILIGCEEEFSVLFIRKMKTLLPTMDLVITKEDANGSVSFLDILFTRHDRRILHKWYTKEYASLRLIDHFSAHSCKIKENLYVELIKKARTLTNHAHNEIYQKIVHILKINHIPKHIGDTYFKKADQPPQKDNTLATTNTHTIEENRKSGAKEIYTALKSNHP